ncbi:DUF726 domain-containing protein [Pectobacterium versatile]|uniref:DUF726 domain-containing protein n=1 Tax=Pectobacterium versatile TaxID=2488639 RepID=UPI0019372F4F|nr:DUF726 domain-containing protein [Pectobacterium versatile]QQK71237.1 DUF726 domain-containing protein [Pectobacterium versatile]
MFWPSGATFGLIQDAISNYWNTERGIPQLAYQFIYKLSEFISEGGVEYKELNFFGHSLGARMIIEAMLKLPNDFNSLKIKNIVFMGGARSLNKDECQRILESISGSIFNIYSDGDSVLQFIKPDLEKCIGRYPIVTQPDSADRVKNHAFHWLGHIDYWDNLNGIINYLNLDHASSHSLIPLGTKGSQVVNPFAVQDVGLHLPLCHATESEKRYLQGSCAREKVRQYKK